MFKGIAAKTIVYTFGGILPAFASFLLLSPLTQYLSPGTYGIQALYLSFSLLLQVLITYGLDQYLVRNYVLAKDEEERIHYVSVVISNVLKIGILVSVLLALIGQTGFQLIFQRDEMRFFPYGLISVLTAIFNSVFRVYAALMIYKESPGRFLKVNLINTFFTLVCIYLGLVYFQDSLFGPVGGRFAAALISCLYVLFQLGKHEKFHLTFETPKKIHRYAFPVMLFGLLVWGMSFGNNYIVNYCFIDIEAISIFDIVLKFVLIIEMFQNGLSSAMSPKLFKLWKEQVNDDQEMRLHQLFNILSVLTISISITVLPIITGWFVKQEFYNNALVYFPLLALSLGLRASYNYFVNPIYFKEKTHRLPVVLSLSFVIHILIALLFIHLFGLTGAFLALGVSRLIQILLLYAFNRDIKFGKDEWLKVFLAPLFYMILSYALYWQLGYSISFIITQLIGGVILMFAFYRRTILYFYRSVINEQN